MNEWRRIKWGILCWCGSWVMARAQVVDQLVVSGNACGPAAVMNSMRYGRGKWHDMEGLLAGKDDREKIKGIIEKYGMRRSKHLPDRARWTKRGVGVVDLLDMINEMSAERMGPRFGVEMMYLADRESPEAMLKRARVKVQASLKRGVPPVVSLNRYVRRVSSSGLETWVMESAHFISLVACEEREQGLLVHYLDPWKGRDAYGQLVLPMRGMKDPQGRVVHLEGKLDGLSMGQVGKGQQSYVAVVGLIGVW